MSRERSFTWFKNGIIEEQNNDVNVTRQQSRNWLSEYGNDYRNTNFDDRKAGMAVAFLAREGVKTEMIIDG